MSFLCHSQGGEQAILKGDYHSLDSFAELLHISQDYAVKHGSLVLVCSNMRTENITCSVLVTAS